MQIFTLRLNQEAAIAKKIKRSLCDALLLCKARGNKKPLILQKRCRLFFISLCCILITSPAFAQWSGNPAVNNAISIATGNQNEPQVVTDGAGGAIIMWLDLRSGIPNIYAQRVNASGATQWTADGVAICTASGGQYRPKIVSDEAGGAIITWFDYRSGALDIYAQRISKLGIVQWASDGVPVCGAADAQFDPSLVSDGAGGAIITWVDYRSFEFYIYDIYIYAQHIDASGAALWTAGGLAVCLGPDYKYFPTIISDGAGGAIITWQDFRNGTYDIYAQRVDDSGDVQWGADGVAVCIAAADQTRPKIVSDGAGGAIITWFDPRNGAGNPDIYAQRVDASGAMQWTVSGAAVCTEGSNQSDPQILGDGAGGATFAWYDYRAGSHSDIYAQRVNSSGAGQWTADGVAVCEAAGDQSSPIISSDGAGGAIITWADTRSVGADIYVQHFNASGAVQWVTNGVAVSTATGIQDKPTLVSDGAGGAIITWMDSRSSNSDIYAQKVKSNGTLGCNSPFVTGEPVHEQTVCKNSAAAQLTVTATGDDLNYQWYVDNDNTGYNGTMISDKTGSSFNPPTTTMGTFYYYAVVSGICGTAFSAYSTVTVKLSTVWYRDSDNDGYGDPKKCLNTCNKCPKGYVPDNKDCNDHDKTIYPGAPELCDNKDNDCDGKVDENLSSKNYYKDEDGDGYGDPRKCLATCDKCPKGYVTNNKDCNDRDKSIYPGAKEICDNKDNDCDGKTDEGFTKKSYYRDYDKDGYGDPKQCIVTCNPCPSGYVTNNKDCDDHNKNIHPGAKEIAKNNIDDNCNGKVDERTTLARESNYEAISDAPDNLLNAEGMLKVNVLPNPSSNYFTLKMKGGIDKPVQLRVVDMAGRLVEVKDNVPAGSTLMIGHNYGPGIYFVEVLQGSERVVVKCIRQ